MVLPENSEPLLGAIPLENMDVVVYPQRKKLTVNPDSSFMSTMTMKELTFV